MRGTNKRLASAVPRECVMPGGGEWQLKKSVELRLAMDAPTLDAPPVRSADGIFEETPHTLPANEARGR